jgi:hypothetical protein
METQKQMIADSEWPPSTLYYSLFVTIQYLHCYHMSCNENPLIMASSASLHITQSKLGLAVSLSRQQGHRSVLYSDSGHLPPGWGRCSPAHTAASMDDKVLSSITIYIGEALDTFLMSCVNYLTSPRYCSPTENFPGKDPKSPNICCRCKLMLPDSLLQRKTFV